MTANLALPFGIHRGRPRLDALDRLRGHWRALLNHRPHAPRGPAPCPERLDLQPRLIPVDFSPRVTIIHERRDTNAQGLDYSKTRGEVSFVKQF